MKLGFIKKPQRQKGKLVVIDGIDGSGKATQSQMLIEELKKSEYPVETADFPQYGKKSAGPIEEYLNGKYGMVDPYIGSIFYAVDRFDASFVLKSQLDQGKIIVSNRYVTASAGHQGSKITDHSERIKFFKWLDNLEYNIFGIPKPDLNILLHVPAEVAQRLIKNKSKETRKYIQGGKTHDIHEKDLEHLKKAEKIFMEISKLFPNTKSVECYEDDRLLTPQEIHNKIWYLVRRYVLEKPGNEPEAK